LVKNNTTVYSGKITINLGKRIGFGYLKCWQQELRRNLRGATLRNTKNVPDIL
jgi:hypothetical protein